MEDDMKEKRDAAISRAAAAYGLDPENPDDRERLLGILAQQRFPPLKILERPMKGDQIDFSPRGVVVQRIERMKYQVTRGPKAFDKTLKEEFDLVKLAELWETPDRKRRGRENANSNIRSVPECFDYLDRYFIAPHAADDPTLADDGYYCVNSLIFSAWGAGCYLNDVMARKVKTRLNGKIGGEKTGAKSRAAAKEWTDQPLPVAKKYAALNPNYSQDTLANHIEHMLDPPVGHSQIKNVISGWQKEGALTKKQVKRASPAKWSELYSIDMRLG